ncbi:zinc dependent phospholipase C family protein [Hymenobacter nivis]|nr:zinc dependent phospholipase C family protein [Hymenobacter nivis]
MKKLLLPLALALLAVGSAGAWGFFGHRLITQVAVYRLPGSMQAFYFRHMAELVRQSTAPDERRNTDPDEAGRHFIDMDHYSEDNPFGKVPQDYAAAVEKFSADTLKKYGTVPWAIAENTEKLTNAFRERDTVAIIKYSAELGHYVSDAFVPLHTTINYDGQLSNQAGLHSLWESALPEKYIAEYNITYGPATYIKDPLAEAWGTVQRSYGFLTETFDRAGKVEKILPGAERYTFSHRYGKTQRRYSDAFADEYEKLVGGMVANRLKLAPTAVASLWLTAWQNAGKPDLDQLMTPNRLSKDEKAHLETELAAAKKNTLAQDHLLLAQRTEKRVENPDEIKAAQEAPAVQAEDVPETATLPDPSATPAGAPAPAKTAAKAAAPVKVKTKSKGPSGTTKSKTTSTSIPW